MTEVSTVRAGAGVLSVHHTSFTVGDIDHWLAFFRDVLGFPTSVKRRSTGARIQGITGVAGAEADIAFASAPNHQIELIQYLAPAGRERSALRPCDTGFTHLALLVSAFDHLMARVTERGFVCMGEPTLVAPASRSAYLRHPDGIVLELIEQPSEAQS